MDERELTRSRRELFGLLVGAGGVALAGCAGEDDPEFDVAIRETNAPVEASQELEIAVLVENVGDDRATDELVLEAASLDDGEELTLDAGERREVVLGGVVEIEDDRPERTVDVSVESTASRASERVTVTNPVEFELELVSAPEALLAGEVLVVEVEITNAGPGALEEPIAVEVDGLGEVATGEVAVGEGQTETVTLERRIDEPVDEATMTVTLADERRSRELSVLAPPDLEVTLAGTNSPLEGEPVEIDVLAQNLGEADATAELSLRFESAVVATEELTLEADSSQIVTLEYAPEVGEAWGDTEFEIVMNGESETVTVEIEPALRFVGAEVFPTIEDFSEVVGFQFENVADTPIAVAFEATIVLEEHEAELDGGEPVSIPGATYTNERTVSVPAESEEVFLLKVPVESLSFSRLEEPEFTLETDFERREEPETAPGDERIVVTGWYWRDRGLNRDFEVDVLNVTEEEATAEVVATVKDEELKSAASERAEVTLDADEEETVELTVSVSDIDDGEVVLVEIAGSREEPGDPSGLVGS